MRDAPLLDLIAARAARETGIAVVLDNERDEWRQLYRALAERFLADCQSGDEFTMEDVRLDMIHVRAMPPPHHPNVWPAMARAVKVEWLKAGRIADHGSRRQLQARHDRIYPLYRVI